MKRVSLCSLAFALNTMCFANDGGISMGGSPGLLDGHPTISMAKEVIHMTVGRTAVSVDCQFTFVNSGPATTVRMGFPDYGLGANDPYEERQTDWNKTKPVSVYNTFKSWVDGRPTPTTLVRSKVENQAWQSKMVQFGKGQTRRVRDVYTMPLGGGVFDSSGYATFAAYVLHTGASWHGNIGSTEVYVTFDPKVIAGPVKPLFFPNLMSSMGRSVSPPASKNEVICQGPCAPVAKGQTLIFYRKNWRPTQEDDIFMAFNYNKTGSGSH